MRLRDMCRFILIKSQNEIHPEDILHRFAAMARRSRSPDGDRQSDGWGVSWFSSDMKWQVYKSTNPIWDESHTFSSFSKSRFIVAHARSAFSRNDKKVLAHNQPFYRGAYAFVFNGLLRGVSFSSPIAGDIGSQKIWTLLQDQLGRFSPEDSLLRLNKMLEENCREIEGLNIGLCDGINIYAYSRCSRHPEYYNLRFHESSTLKIICSEALDGHDFVPVEIGQILTS